jgi:hypothetical protein
MKFAVKLFDCELTVKFDQIQIEFQQVLFGQTYLVYQPSKAENSRKLHLCHAR